jgi:hypothetical protein
VPDGWRWRTAARSTRNGRSNEHACGSGAADATPRAITDALWDELFAAMTWYRTVRCVGTFEV